MNSLNKTGIVVKAGIGILCILLAGVSSLAQAPSHTPRLSPVIDANINGFWEYLPRNYSRDINQKYPLMIFFHGYGDSGSSPDTATLLKVLNAGTPKIIKNGNFPDSFYVAGTWHKFVVISPQIKDGFNFNAGMVDALMDYAVKTYRIDNTRIYLCGLSMGGGIAWEYPGSSAEAADKLAAIAVAAATAALDTIQTDNIADAYLPVLATHNIVDDVVPVTTTIGNIEKLKKSKEKVKNKNKPNKPPVDPEPLVFYWQTPGVDPGNILANHNAWSRTFEDILPGITLGGNLRDTLGYNVYEWMLQYVRSAETPLSVIWENFAVTAFNGTALLQWTTTRELNLKSFTIEKSIDGQHWTSLATLLPTPNIGLSKSYRYIDKELFSDVNYYRIKELDIDERATYSVTKKLYSKNGQAVRIFPNPFNKTLSLSLPSSAVASSLNVKLSDSRGAVLLNEKYTLQPGENLISLKNLQALDPGLYYITILNERGKLLAKEKAVKN